MHIYTNVHSYICGGLPCHRQWGFSKAKKCSTSMDTYMPPEACLVDLLTDGTCDSLILHERLRINYHMFLRVETKACFIVCNKTTLSRRATTERIHMLLTCINICMQLIPSLRHLYRWETGQVPALVHQCFLFAGRNCFIASLKIRNGLPNEVGQSEVVLEFCYCSCKKHILSPWVVFSWGCI